jgi:uncharacterized ParB-like nuclease family protein
MREGKTKIVTIDNIRIDERIQARLGMDAATVEAFAEAMQDGAQFPPIDVFTQGEYEDSEYLLADGFHRVAAAKRINKLAIEAAVRIGDDSDARWWAIGANKTHGLRRTNADKRRALEMALEHPWAKGKSNVEIAAHVGLHEATVRRRREELSSEKPMIRTVTRGGTTYQQDTSQIGKRSEAPAVRKSLRLKEATQILRKAFDRVNKQCSPHLRHRLREEAMWLVQLYFGSGKPPEVVKDISDRMIAAAKRQGA